MLPWSLVNGIIISAVGKKAPEVWRLTGMLLEQPQFLIFCLLHGLQEAPECHRMSARMSQKSQRSLSTFTTSLRLSSHFPRPQGPLPDQSSPMSSAKITREDSNDVPWRITWSVSESRAGSEPEAWWPHPSPMLSKSMRGTLGQSSSSFPSPRQSMPMASYSISTYGFSLIFRR